MQNVTFFRKVYEEYGEEPLYKICKNITYETRPESNVIFKQGTLLIEISQLICCVGDKGHEFFILLRGRVGVCIELQRTVEKPDGTFEKEYYPHEVAEKLTGDSFGELALIEDKPRTATIICKEVCHFAILDRMSYKEILGNNNGTGWLSNPLCADYE